MRAWWRQKYEMAPQSLPFEERSLGDLLREYYTDCASELARLNAKMEADGHDPETEAKISDLERVFSDEPDFGGMDAEESWDIPRRTGDPLADKWEAQIARGETPDFDEAVTDA